MVRSTRFWILMAVFQVAFGLAVFALTRHHYLEDDSERASAHPGPATQHPADWPDKNAGSDLENLISAFPNPSAASDPAALSHQADEYFSRQQYDRAAELYQKLLDMGSENADTYNNLGITLHYLGRSNEALQVLNEGVIVDPAYQRIWLTLGFVNSQVGNKAKAREALTRAAQMEPNTDVGRSATQMLEALGTD